MARKKYVSMADMARRYGNTFNAIKAWRACKQTRFSSMHFLRSRPNNGAVGIPPVSYCSVIHEGVHRYILTPIFP